MPSPPFNTRPLDKPSWLRRILVEPVPHNALIELENQLAACSDVCEVTLGDVHHLNIKFRTDLYRRFRKELDSLYASYIRFCLLDNAFSKEEVAQILYLKSLFCLSEQRHSEVYFRVAEEVYSRNFSDLLSDGNFSSEKKNALQALAGRLAIPEDMQSRIFQADVKHLLSDRIDKALEDRQLSPQEEEELQLLAQSLGTNITDSGGNYKMLEENRLRWQIIHGPLPILDVPLALQDSELCHYENQAEWLEDRVRVNDDIFRKANKGKLYLTSKRVIFVGVTRNISIRLREITGMELYKDGIEIGKSRGRSPTFKTGTTMEFPAIILRRLIMEASS